MTESGVPVVSSDIRFDTGVPLDGDASFKRVDLCRLGSIEPLVRTAFSDSRTSRPRLGMGEFCEGNMGTPPGDAPKCLEIWYAENRLDALLSRSPPL